MRHFTFGEYFMFVWGFFVFVFCILATLHGMRDLISLTRDRT